MSTATIPVAPTIPGVRKAAMFLLGVGDQLGADLLRQLAPDEIRAVTTEISSIDAVAPGHMLDVFREFETLTVDSRFFARGGAEFARRMVEQALGAESAQKYLAPAAPKPSAEAAVEFLEGRDPQQLARFLKAENPQTIALVLSNMSAVQAGALMASLPEDLRPQVALRMASLDRIAPEVFQRISEAIGTKLRALKSVSRSDGIRSLAALLNQVDGQVAEAILARVEQENQAVGASVRDLMFVFDDIPSISPEGIKALLAKLDRKVLTTALKGSSEQIRSQFTQCMSQRAGEMLVEDMEALGPVRIRDVAAAQKQVVAVVRQLQQEGVVSTGRSEDDGYVG
jgi:flagellar motor switch protein FliG